MTWILSSIHRAYRAVHRAALLAIGALALAACAGGCARIDSHAVFYYRPSPARPDRVLPDPVADEATMVRGWDVSTFNYPSGRVVAGPTYNLNYEDRPRWLENDYLFSMVQPGIMILDAIAMPLWILYDPPLKPFMYHGAVYAPSMTVAPPLPAD